MMNALCQRLGREELCAVSAGLQATSGAPASDGARLAMEERGLTLAQHRAQPVTQRLLRDVSLVVGMSAAHIAAVKRLCPGAAVEMRAFAPPARLGIHYEAAGIARAHGGSVRVWSRPGHGSTFTLRLPLNRADPHYRELEMEGS